MISETHIHICYRCGFGIEPVDGKPIRGCWKCPECGAKVCGE